MATRTSTPILGHPRRSLLALIALLVAAAAILAPAGSEAGRPGPKPAPKPGGGSGSTLFGFNEWTTAESLPLQRQLNAPVRRMFVGWHRVQAGGPGSWNWWATDNQYKALVDAGMTPLIVVVGAPCWAHPSNPCEGIDTAWNPPDPEFDGAWAEFNKRVAARYSKSVAIEVWNEPNIAPAFPPYPDPRRYSELLRTAYKAVKSLRRVKVQVLVGGLFAAGASGWYGIADGEFLSAMYEAGAGGFMDGIAVHPYLYSTNADGSKSYDPAAIYPPLDRLRAARDSAGYGSTPLWITETGESTSTQDGFPPAASEEQQAGHLVEVVRAVSSMPDVGGLIVHKLLDRSEELGGAYASVQAGFGVYRSDGTPKRAACALSAELGGSLSC